LLPRSSQTILHSRILNSRFPIGVPEESYISQRSFNIQTIPDLYIDWFYSCFHLRNLRDHHVFIVDGRKLRVWHMDVEMVLKQAGYEEID
jgi:hypothetical protein